jgi:hypothetical protein
MIKGDFALPKHQSLAWEAPQSPTLEKAEISNQHTTKTGLDILAHRGMFLLFKNFMKSSRLGRRI